MMEAILETIDSSDLSQALRSDPVRLEGLIIEEIERALPEIIQDLYVPQVLDRSARQRLEFSVRGRKGFRALPRQKKEIAVQRLEQCAFSDALRTVQHIISTRSQGGSDRRFYWPDDDTYTEPIEPETLATTPIPERKIDKYAISSSELTGLHFLGPDLNTSGPQIETIRTSSSTRAVTTTKEERLKVFDVPNIPIEVQEPLIGRDIRGLIALLRDSRLVAFIEPQAARIIPENIQKINVPTDKIYRSLNIQNLLYEYNNLTVSEDLHDRPERLTELRLIDALLTAMENEAQWSRINRRRFHLINKKYSVGLSSDESAELEQLEQLTTRQMYAALDLPFTELAMLETYARSLGFTNESTAA